MMNWGNNYFNSMNNVSFLPLLVPVVLWSLIWKGLALYRSARNEQKGWFVILLIVNTAGILEIVYLLFFSSIVKGKKSVD